MMITDCQELLERKHYMNCVLNLAQAYELFFSLYFRVELLFRPFAADRNQSIDDLNRLTNELFDNIKKHTFAPMRSLFLQYVVKGQSPKDLTEAATLVAKLVDNPGDPKDAVIESLYRC